MVKTDGRLYVGEYRDGKPHGQGVLAWPGGGRIVGEFRDIVLSRGRTLRTLRASALTASRKASAICMGSATCRFRAARAFKASIGTVYRSGGTLSRCRTVRAILS